MRNRHAYLQLEVGLIIELTLGDVEAIQPGAPSDCAFILLDAGAQKYFNTGNSWQRNLGQHRQFVFLNDTL